jgi:hypothetical protein
MISSISVKQIEHQLGIKAKLVATCLYNSNEKKFYSYDISGLENEIYDKFFIIAFYDYAEDYTIYSGIYSDSIFGYEPIDLWNSNNLEYMKLECEFNYDEFLSFRFIDDIYIDEDSYVQLYELPITLGGEE